MSKNLYLTFSVLTISLFFTSQSTLYAQEEGQLLNEEQIEEYKKRKPEIAELDGIRASLQALRSNGALQRATRSTAADVTVQLRARAATTNNTVEAQSTDTSDVDELVSIKHVLTCETQTNCQVANDWASTNNFNASGVLTSEGHGGEVMYHLFLRQDITADEETIATESNRVHEGVKTLDGISYSTWMVDFDPDGERDAGGNH